MRKLIIVFFITSLISCKKKDTSTATTTSSAPATTTTTTTTTSTLIIGSSYQGGVIASIKHLGDIGYDPNIPHGLIAAPSDQSAGVTWDDGYQLVYGTSRPTSSLVGTGKINTDSIVGRVGNFGSGNYAAKICYDLVLNGYSDWYLPSRDELNILVLNKTIIGGFYINTNPLYWSSSEYSYSHAYFQSFSTSYSSSFNGKNQIYRVRAIRTF